MKSALQRFAEGPQGEKHDIARLLQRRESSRTVQVTTFEADELLKDYRLLTAVRECPNAKAIVK